MAESQQDPWVLAATNLIGDRIITPEGEALGTVQELVIDPGNGSITFAVVTFNALPEFGDALYMIPWKELRPQRQKRGLVFNVDKEELAEFAHDNSLSRQEDADWKWATNGQECYGYRTYRN